MRIGWCEDWLVCLRQCASDDVSCPGGLSGLSRQWHGWMRCDGMSTDDGYGSQHTWQGTAGMRARVGLQGLCRLMKDGNMAHGVWCGCQGCASSTRHRWHRLVKHETCGQRPWHKQDMEPRSSKTYKVMGGGSATGKVG